MKLVKEKQTEAQKREARRAMEIALADKAILNPRGFKHTHDGFQPPKKKWD